jgi:outer membrane lipoprotein SlyB
MLMNQWQVVLGLLCVLTIGCEPSNDRIPKREQGQVQSVLKGTIISMRDVTIQPGDSGRYGAVAGAISGAAVGQSIGTSTSGRITGGLVGGTVGAYAGNEIERAANTQRGYEFVIQLDPDDGSPQSRSTRQRQGEVISVIQTSSEHLIVGDKVYLLMGSRQTRIARR